VQPWKTVEKQGGSKAGLHTAMKSHSDQILLSELEVIMQPIYQNALPFMGYASPVQKPYEEEIPPGLLAFIIQQQENAQREQQQAAQSPLLSAQSGIGGGVPGDKLFDVTDQELLRGAPELFRRELGSAADGPNFLLRLLIEKGNFSLNQPIPISRDAPIPEAARQLLDPGRLRRMDAYQAFDAANEENTPI
jgi:hypothetical protein